MFLKQKNYNFKRMDDMGTDLIYDFEEKSLEHDQFFKYKYSQPFRMIHIKMIIIVSLVESLMNMIIIQIKKNTELFNNANYKGVRI